MNPYDDDISGESSAESSTVEQTPIFFLLMLFWAILGAGAFFLVWAVSSWYGEGETEKGKLALVIVLSMLGFPLSILINTVRQSLALRCGHRAKVPRNR